MMGVTKCGMRNWECGMAGFFLAIGFFFVAASARAETVGRIVAVVNQEVITLRELEEAIARSPLAVGEATAPDAVRQKVLLQLIEQRLILQKAQKLGVTISEEELTAALEKVRETFSSPEEFEEGLAREGLTMEEFRKRYHDQMMIKRMVDWEVRSKVVVSPKALKEYYNAHPEEFKQPERFRLSMILIRHRENPEEEKRARVTAKKLWQRLKMGESFEALAKEFSEGPRKEEGGDLGWVDPRKLLKEISDVVHTAPVGELAPLIETSMGYHLFTVRDRKPEEVLSFRQARPKLEERLRLEKMSKTYQQWMETLKKESYIEIY